jgi:LAO/AO transport system kinase
VQRYRGVQTASGRLAARRQAQDEAWMWERVESGLRQRFRQTPAVRDALATTIQSVRQGRVAASVAARRLLDLFA